MELSKAISILSSQFLNPMFELPGLKEQLKLAPKFRDSLIHQSTINYTPSAVMFLLYPDEEQKAKIVFFERSKHDKDVHGGQIGLPGGKFEQEDKNLIQTAIRETEEEIGVRIDSDKIIGRLTPLKVPVSGFEVTPVIGYSNYELQFVKQDAEVERIVEFYLHDVLTATIKEDNFGRNGQQIPAPYFAINNEKIWGATAMMLAEFLALFQQ